MRLLLYQESDIYGRRLLFDSNGFERISPMKEQSPVAVASNYETSANNNGTKSHNPFDVIEICDDIVYKVFLYILEIIYIDKIAFIM